MPSLTEELKIHNVINKYGGGLGIAAIGYRHSNNPSELWYNAYVLNGLNDGWFRKTNGPAYGYGLCINTIRITGRNAVIMGDFLCFKCSIEYTDVDETEKKDLFWLYVHDGFSVKEVLEYIENNKNNWYP